jgi:hypothetical protein
MITETFRSESHSRVLEEAVQAASLGKGPRWTRDDYEKWLGDYDVGRTYLRADSELPTFG